MNKNKNKIELWVPNNHETELRVIGYCFKKDLKAKHTAHSPAMGIQNH